MATFIVLGFFVIILSLFSDIILNFRSQDPPLVSPRLDSLRPPEQAQEAVGTAAVPRLVFKVEWVGWFLF